MKNETTHHGLTSHPDAEPAEHDAEGGMVVGEPRPAWRDEDIPPDPDAYLKHLLWRFRDEVPYP